MVRSQNQKTNPTKNTQQQEDSKKAVSAEEIVRSLGEFLIKPVKGKRPSIEVLSDNINKILEGKLEGFTFLILPKGSTLEVKSISDAGEYHLEFTGEFYQYLEGIHVPKNSISYQKNGELFEVTVPFLLGELVIEIDSKGFPVEVIAHSQGGVETELELPKDKKFAQISQKLIPLKRGDLIEF